MTSPLIPFIDLKRSFDKARILATVERVFDSGNFLYGQEVRRLEEELASLPGVTDAITTSNGTDALSLCARAMCDGYGLVVTVANSAVPTVSAFASLGMKIHYVDVDDRGLMSMAGLERGLYALKDSGEMVGAVVPVDLYGQPVDVKTIYDITKKYFPAAVVIEDMAQGYGMTDWEMQGDAATLSFYPTKVVGCLGDGGAVLLKNSDFSKRCRSLAFYGVEDKTTGIQREFGVNTRLSEIQAAIMFDRILQSSFLLQSRRDIAKAYDEVIPDKLRLPYDPRGNYYVYPVLVENRDLVRRILLDKFGIGTAVHYPIPAHLQPSAPVYFDLPNTERLCGTILSLPVWPGMTIVESRYVARSFLQAVDLAYA